MTKQEIKELRKFVLMLREKIGHEKWNFGAGPFVVYDGTDHIVAKVEGGLYGETPMDNMQEMCLAKNNIHKLIDAILELTKGTR